MNHAPRHTLPWTPEEDALILDPPPELRRPGQGARPEGRNLRALGALLGRSTGAVKHRLDTLRRDRAAAAA